MHKIRLDKIWFKNLFSYGNNENTYEFKPGMTWISGRNGAGKSSLIESVTLLWFNRPFRNKIKKADVKNTLNPKGKCVVGGEFARIDSNGETKYWMEREFDKGGATVRTELLKDGVAVPIPAGIFQEEFESSVLGFDQKIFEYVISLNTIQAKPFIDLVPEEKRQLLESITSLSVEIWKEKNKDLKKTAKIRIEAAKSNYSASQDELLSLNSTIESLATDKKAKTDSLNAKKERLSKEAEETAAKVTEVSRAYQLANQKYIEQEQTVSKMVKVEPEEFTALARVKGSFEEIETVKKDLETTTKECAEAKILMEAKLADMAGNDLASLQAEQKKIEGTIAKGRQTVALCDSLIDKRNAYDERLKKKEEIQTRINEVNLEPVATKRTSAEIKQLQSTATTDIAQRTGSLARLDAEIREFQSRIQKLDEDAKKNVAGIPCKTCGKPTTQEDVDKIASQIASEKASMQLLMDQKTNERGVAQETLEKAKAELENSHQLLEQRLAFEKSVEGLGREMQIADSEIQAVLSFVNASRETNPVMFANLDKVGGWDGGVPAIEAYKKTAEEAVEKFTQKMSELQSKIAVSSSLNEFYLSAKAQYDRLVLAVGGYQSRLSERQRIISDSGLKSVEEVATKHAELTSRHDAYMSQEKVLLGLNVAAMNAKSEVQLVENNLKSLNDQLVAIDTEIANLASDAGTLQKTLDRKKVVEQRIEEISRQLDELSDEVTIAQEIDLACSNEGIRKYVLSVYVPQLNLAIASNMSVFGLPYSVSFKDNMDLVFTSRHGAAPVYGALSQGQQRLINFAILMAFRDFVLRIANFNINTLFIDEVLDISTDSTVHREMILALRRSMKGDQTINLVTHQGENVKDLFDRIIRVSHDGFFSSLEVEYDGGASESP